MIQNTDAVSQHSHSGATGIDIRPSSVRRLFEEGWLHPNKPLPVVRTIFRLLKTGDEMGEYHLYRQALR